MVKVIESYVKRFGYTNRVSDVRPTLIINQRISHVTTVHTWLSNYSGGIPLSSASIILINMQNPLANRAAHNSEDAEIVKSDFRETRRDEFPPSLSLGRSAQVTPRHAPTRDRAILKPETWNRTRVLRRARRRIASAYRVCADW